MTTKTCINCQHFTLTNGMCAGGLGRCGLHEVEKVWTEWKIPEGQKIAIPLEVREKTNRVYGRESCGEFQRRDEVTHNYD